MCTLDVVNRINHLLSVVTILSAPLRMFLQDEVPEDIKEYIKMKHKTSASNPTQSSSNTTQNIYVGSGTVNTGSAIISNTSSPPSPSLPTPTPPQISTASQTASQTESSLQMQRQILAAGIFIHLLESLSGLSMTLVFARGFIYIRSQSRKDTEHLGVIKNHFSSADLKSMYVETKPAITNGKVDFDQDLYFSVKDTIDNFDEDED
ncbi:hypothetical protein BDF21DRAFT_402235 [Thamnidium elegans]|nr:hypothetical protein BDF21DRAFT_402235 [Thamnidium elegans]